MREAGSGTLVFVLALIVVGAIAVVVYLGVQESAAERQAREFCLSIEPNSELSEVAEAVKTVGEDRLRMETDETLTVGFTGIPPFSRHLCSLHHDGRSITSTEYFHLD